MTQEQKAKAYDKALERAKVIINDYEERGLEEILFYAKEDLEGIFPELKESEDERIKKVLIKFHKSTIDIDGIKGEQIIAWLEKQSNTIPDECVFRPVAGCNIESAAKQAIKQQGVLAKKIVLAFNGAYIPVGGKAADIVVNEYESWLEKQGGIDNCPLECSTNTVMTDSKKNQVEPNPYSGTSFEYNGHIWGMCARDGGAEVSMDGNLKAFISSDASFIYPDIPQPNLALKSALEEFKEEKVDNANKVEQNLANSAKTCKKSQRMVSAEAKEALYDKPAWSEEDEEMLDGIILRCEKYGHQEQIDWLKSIKQRIKGE